MLTMMQSMIKIGPLISIKRWRREHRVNLVYKWFFNRNAECHGEVRQRVRLGREKSRKRCKRKDHQARQISQNDQLDLVANQKSIRTSWIYCLSRLQSRIEMRKFNTWWQMRSTGQEEVRQILAVRAHLNRINLGARKTRSLWHHI